MKGSQMMIVALACFFAKNSSAMLEEVLLDLDPQNTTTNLVNLAEKKRHATLHYDKTSRCCAFLDCLFGNFSNLKTQSTFTIWRVKHVIPNE